MTSAVVRRALYIPPSIEVHLNKGNGVLESYVAPHWNTHFSNGIALGDVDHDGDLDVIGVTFGVTPTSGPPYFYINDGAGHLAIEPAGLRIAGEMPGMSVCATDLDGDGWVDLFFGMTDPNQPRVYLNDRTGRFVDVTFTHLPWAIPGCAQHVVAADLDNDGDQDLVIAMGGACGRKQENVVLYNDGRGHLTPLILQRTPEWHRYVAVGDVTGDGLPDLVFTSYNGLTALWQNQLSSFADISPRLPAGTYATCAAITDVNDDGWNDIVACIPGYNTFNLLALLNQGGQSFVSNTTSIQGGANLQVHALVPADMDGDGDRDLVVTGHYPFPDINDLKVLMHRHRHTLPATGPTIGSNWPIDFWAHPGQYVLPALATASGRIDLGALGVFGLDPASTILLPVLSMPSCQRTLTLAIPNMPSLRNRSIFWQALVVDPLSPAETRLTNWTEDVLR